MNGMEWNGMNGMKWKWNGNGMNNEGAVRKLKTKPQMEWNEWNEDLKIDERNGQMIKMAKDSQAN